jgi:hypothetical protein
MRNMEACYMSDNLNTIKPLSGYENLQYEKIRDLFETQFINGLQFHSNG